MNEDNFQPIDLLYVLGKGSQWNNNELRYSLRSVVQNLSGFRYIWIVGEDPGFTQNVRIIKHSDEIGPHNADGNITRKIVRACQETELAEHFIMMNDDYLFVNPVNAADIQPMHKGDMTLFSESYFQSNTWRHRLRRTRDILIQKNLPTLHFDYHAPLILQKSLFPDAVAQFDYHLDIGYCTRSMYGNIHLAQSAIPLEGQKERIFKYHTIAQVKQKAKTALFFSYNDMGLNKSFKIWLAQQFPFQSPFENSDITDEIHTVTLWFLNGCDYQQGATIFQKFRRHNNLNFLFQSRYSDVLHKKMKYQLEKTITEY
jgi:hypothetical protein